MDIKQYKIKLVYRKTGFIRLYSHLDMARFLERALRRSGLPFYLTQGFNPHPKISYFGGVKLGLEGEAEAVFSFVEDISVEVFQEAMRKNFPPELEIVKVEKLV